MAAVQLFNSPAFQFKSETYIVLMIIAWTYLHHAYFQSIRVDYRYVSKVGKRRSFVRIHKHGPIKQWELAKCLEHPKRPVDDETAANLRFLIELRDEIEHRGTTRLDELLGPRFQACCLNYHDTISRLFGAKYGLAHEQAMSLQFSALSREQVDAVANHPGLPAHIKRFIEGFDGALTPAQRDSPKFKYKVIFLATNVNHPNQADQTITFLKPGDPAAEKLRDAYAAIYPVEKGKWRPTRVVKTMKAEGFAKFTLNAHAKLWQQHDAKDKAKGYGADVEGYWYWYDSWVDVVRKHCKDNASGLGFKGS